jgi:flagellar biosynthesis anti-sigma factor FlgM
MEMRNSLEGLKALFGVSSAVTTPLQPAKNGASVEGQSLAGDQATLSSAGSEISLAAADSGVRMEKVAAIQAALATGTYSVPASAVAEKVIDSMLVSPQSPRG